MKQIISSAVITLVIGMVVAYFAFTLNKEYVDLRYTLSEKIPTKFIETSTAETVQQLVIKNNGNIPATKIQITIDGVVEDYDILKNAISDVVEEHNSKGHFEAIYPSLPPDGQFSYIFKTSGMGISKYNLSIKHNKGKAQEALASDKESFISSLRGYFILAVIIFYLIMFVFHGRSMAIDQLESSGSYTNYYDFLSKKKPFYVSQDKWNSIRRKYIEKKNRAEYLHSSDIEAQESYKILNQDKPKFISDDEWELLKEHSSKCLTDQLTYSIKTSSIFLNLEKYFTIKRPEHFPENKWQEIVKEINENFITSKKLKQSFYRSTKDIVKELEIGMPIGMSLSSWNEYKKFLIDRYFEIIKRDILRETSPITYLKEIDLSVLPTDDQESLEDLAYRIQLIRLDNISSLYFAEKFLKNDRPAWIKEEDFEQLVEKAEAYVAIEKSKNENESLSNVLNEIVNLIPLKDKPENMDSKKWDKVIELERKISTIAIQIEEDKSKLETEKQETQKLKSKILKQLEIIDGTLTDPKSIDRIEPYDNPFAEGNFENLRTVSNILKRQQNNT